MQDYVVLNRTGDKMPLVGFGTARISEEETEQVVYNAIKTGYRYKSLLSPLVSICERFAKAEGMDF